MLTEPSAQSVPKSAARTNPQRPARRGAKAGQVALFIFLALTAAQCVRLGVAGLFVQLGQFEVDGWTEPPRPPAKAEISRAANYFSHSLDYASDNPWALEGIAAMDLATMRASKIPREALAATKDASERLRQALRQRPTSPFLWVNLALTKLYLNEIDGELLAALRHAEELGPWEQTIQQITLFVGLAVWQELDPELRQAIARTLQRGASRIPQKMFEIVKSYGRLDLVCAIEKYRPAGGLDCEKVAATAKSGESIKQGYRQ
jgi:hypothetical protein